MSTWIAGKGTIPAVTTNYDRIIRKTPEELADWISNVPYREGDVCPPTHKCSLDMSCEKCWLAWLQKEASE